MENAQWLHWFEIVLEKFDKSIFPSSDSKLHCSVEKEGERKKWKEKKTKHVSINKRVLKLCVADLFYIYIH